MEPLPSFLRARLSTAAVISLSSPILRCCFRALLHPVRSAARPSQDISSVDVDSLHISYAGIFISHCEGGRWFSSPKPAHSRGCLLECDHPRCGGHGPTIAACSVNVTIPQVSNYHKAPPPTRPHPRHQTQETTLCLP